MNKLIRTIREATEDYLINWKPTGEEIRDEYEYDGRTIKGYQAKIDNFLVKTTFATKEKKGFWGNKTIYGYALEIKEGKDKIVLTSNQEIIPGKEHEYIKFTVRAIDRNVRGQNPVDSLTVRLTKKLTQKLRKLLV